MRFFNTEGPVRADLHYCLPPLGRWDLDEVLTLIERQKYCLLHAPRQTGKTTCLLALREHLHQAGRYRAVYANLEGAQACRENVEQGMAMVTSGPKSATDSAAPSVGSRPGSPGHRPWRWGRCSGWSGGPPGASASGSRGRPAK